MNIRTYRELTDSIAAFGDGYVNTMVICSSGGVGKSEEARRTLDGRETVHIGGHVTPLKLYERQVGNLGPLVFLVDICVPDEFGV